MSVRAQAPCLIVNADDYGYYDCVSRGILHASRRGIVTATGIPPTGKRFEQNCAWLKDHADLDMGVHLNLTDGAPLTPIMHKRLARWQDNDATSGSDASKVIGLSALRLLPAG